MSCLAADGGWTSACLIAPHRAFADELGAATTHAMPLVTVPPHSPGCTYPMLHRLKLLPLSRATAAAAAEERAGGDAAMEEDEVLEGGSLGQVAALGAVERTLLEEYTWMIAHAFCESHKDASKVSAM